MDNNTVDVCEDKFQKLSGLIDKRFTAYLYDCDGTLADNMMAHKEAWVVTAAKYGIDLDPAMIDEMAGTPTIKIVPVMNERYGTNVDAEEFATTKSALYFNEYLPKCQPMDFVVRHLKESHGKVKIAVVSGSSRKTVLRTLEIIGLTPYIETLVCAGDTELGKPHPDPFLRAAELLGVAPQDCFVFEDAPGGVAAATAAGMEWVRVDKL